jgi:hypothetical protein
MKTVPDLITDNDFSDCHSVSEVRNKIDEYFDKIVFSLEKSEWNSMSESVKANVVVSIFRKLGS